MILTGQRRSEIAGLAWNELDRDRAEWILPAERSKNRRAHLVPLNSAAIAELEALAGDKEWPSDGLVLPSSRGTPLSGFSKIKLDWDRRIAARLSAEPRAVVSGPWRLHDLRWTVATGMQMLHISTAVVEAVLNHLSGGRAGIVGVYQCYDFQAEKRAALDAWGRRATGLSISNSVQSGAGADKLTKNLRTSRSIQRSSDYPVIT